MVQKEFIRQLLVFGIVGVVQNMAGYILYLVLTYRLLSSVGAIAVCYPLGVLMSFYGNRKFTFIHKGSALSSAFRFAVMHLIGFTLNIIIMFVFTGIFAFPHQLVQLFAICVVAVYLFVMCKHFVFRSENGTL